MKQISKRVDVGWPILEYAKAGTGFIPRQGPVPQSNYFLMSRPVLWMGLVFGRMPVFVKSGWMTYSFTSYQFAYALIVLLINWAFHAYYHERIAKVLFRMLEDNVSFSSVLLSFLIFTQPFTAVVHVYSSVYELPAIVKCYNTTAILEKKMAGVFSNCTTRPSTRCLGFFFIYTFSISFLTGSYFFLIDRFRDPPPIIILLMVVNIGASFCYALLWCCNFYFIRVTAVNLNKQMLSCLQVRSDCASKLKTFRSIWVSVWKQSQSYSDSIAITVSFTLVTSAIIFVIGCYGVSASLRKDKLLEIAEMGPFLGFTFGKIVSIFEMSYQATNKLGPTFLHSLITHDRDTMDRECKEEIGKFINTINLARNATITLKGYMTVDRTLLVSFLSYSLTYLIVLIQLQGKSSTSDCIQSPLGNNTNEKYT